MPRGGGRGPKKNYKGRSRHFTDAETLREQLEKEKREKEWRKARGEEDEEEPAEGATAKVEKDEDESSSSSEESTDDEDKHKGVAHLIEIENPNRLVKKTKKLSAADSLPNTGPQLSRKEREELEKQQAKERYNKLHSEGKTEEARTDLARLALIRKQREDAAKKREEEKLAKEAKDAAKNKS